MLWQSYFISRKSMTNHSKQSSKIYMDGEHGSISIHEIVVAEVFSSTQKLLPVCYCIYVLDLFQKRSEKFQIFV